ncbi:hypothetical protein ScPMuIL_015962 [Solemya velum]
MPQNVVRNCHPHPTNSNGNGNDIGHTERRVVCKSDKGEEKCVIETRTRMKAPECEGHCTQTCTVTPIKLDTCGGPELNAEGPIPNFSGDARCIEKGSAQQPNVVTEETIFSGDFTSKLDEVSEYYQKKGWCPGEECSKVHVQQGGQKPHIKLDFVNGVLHQKFIFVQSSTELPVEPHECVIFNDGSKSSGCSRPEFRAYEETFQNIASVEFIVEDSEFDDCKQPGGGIKQSSLTPLLKIPEGPRMSSIFFSATGENIEKKPEADLWQKEWHQFSKEKELPETELRDTTVHAGGKYHIKRPSLEECNKYKHIKFQDFTSTWMSVTAKGIDLKKHIDFTTPVKDREEPRCVTEYATHIPISELPGLRNQNNLNYAAESGLKEVMQRLNGDPQPVAVLATRIASAMQQNTTSWVLANMAALYWRVIGRAAEALDCLKLALTTAPEKYRDISLISMANILHRAGYTNDAIVVTDMALGVSNQIAISHFTLANLYASKGRWDMAANFYGSTLNLQTTFQPAIQRYKSIICKFLT